jgi:ABC-type sulfate/molybdate transport systems ATPase subunit
MSFLEVSHLSKQINDTNVLQDISFQYPAFQRLAVAGETGSGKTTLLKAIAGLVQPTSGSILFEEERVVGPDEKLLPGHPRLAYLSQHFELRNNYRVGDYLQMASTLAEPAAQRIYALCQIDHLLQRKTDQLSGGERQRAALARLLTTSPRLLVLDEPYSNLDGIHRQQMKDVINNIVEEARTSCLLVSHDPADVLPWAEEILVLKNGKIVQQGSPQQVYGRPADEYTAGLFGDYNLLSAAEAMAIFGAKGLAEGQRLFVRPENIQLVRGEYFGQQKGCVTAVSFFGSYVETDVLFATVTLRVKTLHPSWQKGDIVSANVDPDKVWIL